MHASDQGYGLNREFWILPYVVLRDALARPIFNIDAAEGTIAFGFSPDSQDRSTPKVMVEDEFGESVTRVISTDDPTPENARPDGQDDAHRIDPNDVVRTDILNNDSDPEGNEIEIVSITYTDTDGIEVTFTGPFDPYEPIEIQSADDRTGLLTLDETASDPFVPRTLAFDPKDSFDDPESGATDTITLT